MSDTTIHELVPPGGWACDDGSVRIPAPPPEQRGFVFRLISKGSRFVGRASVPDVFSVFQINGRLFWPWLIFASRMMPGGRLEPRIREIVILRTAWACRSRYEWGQHVELALKAGATDADIVAVTKGPDAFSDERDRTVIAACDAICANRTLDDAGFAAVKRFYSDALAIELVVLVGHYVMLAGLLNTSNIALDADMEQELAAFTARMGR